MVARILGISYNVAMQGTASSARCRSGAEPGKASELPAGFTADAVVDRTAAFRSIRLRLGLTQAGASRSLGVSTKAVESYEQGWRRVPEHALRHLLTLLALRQRYEWNGVPCWEQMGCKEALRQQCASFRISGGRFCWLVASNECQRSRQGNVKGVLNCIGCRVLGRYLSESPAA